MAKREVLARSIKMTGFVPPLGSSGALTEVFFNCCNAACNFAHSLGFRRVA
jgi:hypothetical protein